MPVRIWMISSVIEAEPKMYHQPIGPAAPLGMGWASTGITVSRSFSRASNQPPTLRSMRPIVGLLSTVFPGVACLQGVLQGRVVGRLHPQFIAAQLPVALVQAARRRPRGVGAVGVVDAPVAGAHEKARLPEPRHP